MQRSILVGAALFALTWASESAPAQAVRIVDATGDRFFGSRSRCDTPANGSLLSDGLEFVMCP